MRIEFCVKCPRNTHSAIRITQYTTLNTRIKMALWLLVAFYLIIAGCEILSPDKCLYLFEKLINNTARIRCLSIFVFLIAFLYYTAEPKRLQWFISILFWIYLLSGIWFSIHPQSFILLCDKSYSVLNHSEKRIVIRADCAMRTILALLLIYAI